MRGQILITGGHFNDDGAEQILLSTEIVDPSDSVTCKSYSLPNPMKYAASASIENPFLVLICGGESQNHTTLSECWHLSENSNWFIDASLNDPRSQFSLTSVRNQILAVGGKQVNGAISSVEKYDRFSKKWEKLANIPMKVFAHCTANYGENEMVTFGGQAQNSNGLFKVH